MIFISYRKTYWEDAKHSTGFQKLSIAVIEASQQRRAFIALLKLKPHGRPPLMQPESTKPKPIEKPPQMLLKKILQVLRY